MAWTSPLRRLLLPLVLLPLASHPTLAAESEVCKRARAQLGEPFKGATEAQCQQALDQADEDRWQLWLDVARAAELTGDLDRAALTLDRFVREADRRGRLSDEWASLRDEARTEMARLDAKVLETRARVVINSTPEGAEIEIVGTPGRPKPDTTPATRYFAPGAHTVRLTLREPRAQREVTFSVTAGQTTELKVDLRPGAPQDVAIVETPAPTVLGQRPPADSPGPSTPTTPSATPTVTPTPVGDPGSTTPTDLPPIEPRTLPDPDDVALVRSGPGPLTRIGTVAITLGAAALAAGTVFTLQWLGLEDEAECAGLACEVDQPLRARVRADAGIARDRAIGSIIAGVVLVGGGITAIIRDTPDEPTATTTISPWLSPDGAGVTTRLRF